MNIKKMNRTISGLLGLVFVMAFAAGLFAHDQATSVFFIAGEVTAPGKYELKEGLTLLKAVALAKGTTEKASVKHAVIFREAVGSEKRQEIPVDLESISKGQTEDIRLQHNDIVVIPNSKLKKTIILEK